MRNNNYYLNLVYFLCGVLLDRLILSLFRVFLYTCWNTTILNIILPVFLLNCTIQPNLRPYFVLFSICLTKKLAIISLIHPLPLLLTFLCSRKNIACWSHFGKVLCCLIYTLFLFVSSCHNPFMINFVFRPLCSLTNFITKINLFTWTCLHH